MKHEQITKEILAAFYAVYNTLGSGFLESVCQGAMAVELEERGLQATQQAEIEVVYRGHKIGVYFADLLVENCSIVELKAVENVTLAHEAQLVNYLKATRIENGLLLNFGPQPTVKRKIHETARNGAL